MLIFWQGIVCLTKGGIIFGYSQHIACSFQGQYLGYPYPGHTVFAKEDVRVGGFWFRESVMWFGL